MRICVKQMVAFALSGVMLLGLVATTSPAAGASAAAKPKLSARSMTLVQGAKKTLKVKGKKIKSTKWSVTKGKKNISLSAKKKTSVKVTAKKDGSAAISAKVKYGKKTANLTCKIKVNKKNTGVVQPSTVVSVSTAPVISSVPSAVPSEPVASVAPSKKPIGTISMNETELKDMPYNSMRALWVSEASDPNTELEAEWSSSNPEVATVTNDGKVLAHGAGSCIITAKVEDQEVTCRVSVIKQDLGTVIVNTDFENGTLEGWVTRNTNEVPKAEVVDDPIEEKGKCLKITGRTNNAQGALLDLSHIVEPSATYELRTWVRMDESASPQVALLFSEQLRPVKGGESTYTNIFCYTTKASNHGSGAQYKLVDPRKWTEVVYEINTPDDVDDYGVYFECGNDGGSDLYVDQTILTLKSRNKPTESLESLSEAYKDIFPHLGVMVTYSGIMGENACDFVRSQYNSISMDNEMKPEALMGKKMGDDTLITEEEAKKRGYYIPEKYASFDDNKVDGEVKYISLDFTKVDQLMEQAKKRGVKMRLHTLVWHTQTPLYYFKQEFMSGMTAPNCSQEAMDTRLEFYIKSVLNHILASENGDALYSVDVVNEYFHSHNAHLVANNPQGTTYYEKIYEVNEDGGSTLTTTPSYVKRSFKYAHEALVANKREDVSLISNDFDSYNMTDRIIEMINWINEKDDINPEGEKICDGVGMQSHLGMGTSVNGYKAALEKFAAEDFEIMVTELDISSTASKEEEQADKFEQVFQALIDVKKAGGNITSVTIWGLYDGLAKNWLTNSYPLPFKGLANPKEAYWRLIELAKK